MDKIVMLWFGDLTKCQDPYGAKRFIRVETSWHDLGTVTAKEIKYYGPASLLYGEEGRKVMEEIQKRYAKWLNCEVDLWPKSNPEVTALCFYPEHKFIRVYGYSIIGELGDIAADQEVHIYWGNAGGAGHEAMVHLKYYYDQWLHEGGYPPNEPIEENKH